MHRDMWEERKKNRNVPGVTFMKRQLIAQCHAPSLVITDARLKENENNETENRKKEK